jgi:MFS family permease
VHGTRFRFFRAALRVPDGVLDSHLALLFAVALASFFEEYDIATLTSALKHISADLGIEERTLPNVLGTIRLGALPALAFIPYADRVGRRRVFLVSVVAIGLFTFATAFSRTQVEFVALQMLTRTFFVTGSAVGFVIVAEEFPAAHRGFGIGLLGALAITGYGFSAMLFALVDHLPFGWRFLYVVGLTPVLLYPRLAKRVKETRRFEEHARSSEGTRGTGLSRWLEPLRTFGSRRPFRTLGIALAGLVPSFGIIATFQFTGYFTQTVHGWSPQDYAALVVAAGGVGVVGNLVSGRLADRFGRRIVGAAQLASFPLFATIFYRGTGAALPFAWAACVFSSQGGRTILRAQATELFPTRSRGAASGLFAILDVIGAAAGLFVLGRLIHGSGELARTIPWIAAVTALGGVVILLFPETTNRELESLS